MATRVCKWTREEGGRRDFFDLTRRGHLPLAFHLSHDEVHRLQQLATKSEEPSRALKEKSSLEEVFLRRSIKQLRDHLRGDIVLDEISALPQVETKETALKVTSVSALPKIQTLVAKRPELGLVHLTTEDLGLTRQELEDKIQVMKNLQEEAILGRPEETVKERSERIKKEMIECLARQVEEKIKLKGKENESNAKWGSKVKRQDQEEKLNDRDQYKLQNLIRKNYRKELDKLCEEKKRKDALIKLEELEARKAIYKSNELYQKYQDQVRREKLEAKLSLRKIALKDMAAAEATRRNLLLQEVLEGERNVSYGLYKRAYARKVRHALFERIKGRRRNARVGPPCEGIFRVKAPEPVDDVTEGKNPPKNEDKDDLRKP